MRAILTENLCPPKPEKSTKMFPKTTNFFSMFQLTIDTKIMDGKTNYGKKNKKSVETKHNFKHRQTYFPIKQREMFSY